jgi:hypothetical protein
MGLPCSTVWGVGWFCLTEDMASDLSERGKEHSCSVNDHQMAVSFSVSVHDVK